jgi:hypothetical protein
MTMRIQTQWQVGPDSRVIVHPRDEFDPPRLFMADATTSVALVVPSDRARHPEFVQFLSDLAEAARELASECEVP